jgi:hypothetical protein
MSTELMVGTKGLFMVVTVSIPLVLVSLVALLPVSGWLQHVIVLTAGFGFLFGLAVQVFHSIQEGH